MKVTLLHNVLSIGNIRGVKAFSIVKGGRLIDCVDSAVVKHPCHEENDSSSTFLLVRVLQHKSTVSKQMLQLVILTSFCLNHIKMANHAAEVCFICLIFLLFWSSSVEKKKARLVFTM